MPVPYRSHRQLRASRRPPSCLLGEHPPTLKYMPPFCLCQGLNRLLSPHNKNAFFRFSAPKQLLTLGSRCVIYIANSTGSRAQPGNSTNAQMGLSRHGRSLSIPPRETGNWKDAHVHRDTILGLLTIVAAYGFTVFLILTCRHRIDRVAREKLGSLREIVKDLRNGH